MKTSEEILEFLTIQMKNMLSRPKMYASNAIDFEAHILDIFGTCRFILNGDTYYANVFSSWRIFAHGAIGYKGSLTVAEWMKRNSMLDDDNWSSLIEVLSNFISFYSTLHSRPFNINILC